MTTPTTITTTCVSSHVMLLSVTCCAALLLPTLHASVTGPSRDQGHRVGVRNNQPAAGGVSTGGTSTGREEGSGRLGDLRHSLLKTFDAVFNTEPGSRDHSQTNQRSFEPCKMEDPDALHQLFPGRFMSETDMMHMVPGSGQWVSNSRSIPYKPQRRFVTQTGTPSTARDKQFQQQPAFNIKSGTAEFLADSIPCGLCVTEIGYEIVDQITDFTGLNHTVINFQNAYQFIPSGRCANEYSACGWGGSTCRQITRAHWSLVWTPGIGVNLVAHEVPNHCQCLNIGTNTFDLQQQQKVAPVRATVGQQQQLKLRVAAFDSPNLGQQQQQQQQQQQNVPVSEPPSQLDAASLGTAELQLQQQGQQLLSALYPSPDNAKSGVASPEEFQQQQQQQQQVSLVDTDNVTQQEGTSQINAQQHPPFDARSGNIHSSSPFGVFPPPPPLQPQPSLFAAGQGHGVPAGHGNGGFLHRNQPVTNRILPAGTPVYDKRHFDFPPHDQLSPFTKDIGEERELARLGKEEEVDVHRDVVVAANSNASPLPRLGFTVITADSDPISSPSFRRDDNSPTSLSSSSSTSTSSFFEASP